jgi:hypothetical protein
MKKKIVNIEGLYTPPPDCVECGCTLYVLREWRLSNTRNKGD